MLLLLLSVEIMFHIAKSWLMWIWREEAVLKCWSWQVQVKSRQRSGVRCFYSAVQVWISPNSTQQHDSKVQIQLEETKRKPQAATTRGVPYVKSLPIQYVIGIYILQNSLGIVWKGNYSICNCHVLAFVYSPRLESYLYCSGFEFYIDLPWW